jgi:hypothetical protein
MNAFIMIDYNDVFMYVLTMIVYNDMFMTKNVLTMIRMQAASNMNDLVFEYQQYQDATADLVSEYQQYQDAIDEDEHER